MKQFIKDYLERFNASLSEKNFDEINNFCEILKSTIKNNSNMIR